MKDTSEKKQINVFIQPAKAVEMMEAVGANTAGAAVCVCATIGLNALRSARLTREEAMATSEMPDEHLVEVAAAGKAQETAR